MLTVGLVGQIGSGKSTAGRLFQDLGAPVIDTDHLARIVIERPAVLQQIIAHFGPAVVATDGQLDRSQLKWLIFNQLDAKQWLEQLMHPQIEQLLIQYLQSLQSPYAIVQLPLLLAQHRRTYIDRLLVIETHAQLQQQRVLARDSLDPLLLQQIINSQASTTELRQVADDILVNNTDLMTLQAQVLTCHQRYVRFAESKETPN